MKSKLPILITGFSLLLYQFTFAQNKKNLDSLDAVVKKLDEQRTTIKSQQQRIAELEKMLDLLKQKKPFITVPEAPNYPKPKNGVPFKFNGETYYMVPLKGSKTDEELLKNITLGNK